MHDGDEASATVEVVQNVSFETSKVALVLREVRIAGGMLLYKGADLPAEFRFVRMGLAAGNKKKL